MTSDLCATIWQRSNSFASCLFFVCFRYASRSFIFVVSPRQFPKTLPTRESNNTHTRDTCPRRWWWVARWRRNAYYTERNIYSGKVCEHVVKTIWTRDANKLRSYCSMKRRREMDHVWTYPRYGYARALNTNVARRQPRARTCAIVCTLRKFI